MFLDKIASVFFDDPNKQAAAIIHSVTIEMGCVGFFSAQIPGDKFVIGGAQVEMVRRIARVYRVRLDRAEALGVLSATIATMGAPTLAAEGANQIIKYVPGCGNVSNLAVASSITELIGWTCARWFREGSWFQYTKHAST